MRKLSLYITLIVSVLFSSCDDFLSAYSQDMVIPKNVSDLDELLLGDVYIASSEVSSGPSGARVCGFLNILDDDLNVGKGDPLYNNTTMGWMNCVASMFGYYAWQLEVGVNYNGAVVANDAATWNDLYYRINVINVILDEIVDLPHETDEDNATYYRVLGESHFLRAAFYFYLANLYGDAYAPSTCNTKLCVPLKLTPYVEHDKDKETQFKRATVKEVYDQIVSDLQKAEECFAISPQKDEHRLYRASMESVNLLMSRVYLYMQEWELAEQKADAVMKSKLVRLASLSSLGENVDFLTENNPEIIFSQGSNSLVTDGIFNGGPGDFCVSMELRKMYSEKDRRAACFFGVASNDSISLSTKYKRGVYRARVSDVFAMRLSEAYLNKAEACAMQSGKESTALSLLNTLRSNRIEDYADETYSGEELVKQIRDERRKELCFEGHRWFDLRRYAVCEKYPFSKKIIHVFNACGDNTAYLYTQVFCLNEGDYAYTFSIPKDVIDFDTVPMENNPRDERKPIEGEMTNN